MLLQNTEINQVSKAAKRHTDAQTHTRTHLVHIKTVTPHPRLQEVRSTHKQ